MHGPQIWPAVHHVQWPFGCSLQNCRSSPCLRLCSGRAKDKRRVEGRMKMRSVFPLIALGSMLVTGLTLMAQSPDSARITTLLQHAREHAAKANLDAEQIEAFTRSKTSWHSHAEQLRHMTEDVNELGKDMSEFDICTFGRVSLAAGSDRRYQSAAEEPGRSHDSHDPASERKPEPRPYAGLRGLCHGQLRTFAKAARDDRRLHRIRRGKSDI